MKDYSFVKLSRKLVNRATEFFFEYETPRILEIHDKHIGVLNRFVQITIVAYIAISVMYMNRGYQSKDHLVSGVATKTRGMIKISQKSHQSQPQIMDATDYLVPKQMNGAIFITTNFISTPEQKMGKCSEAIENTNAYCESDGQCERMKFSQHGIMSGRCINSTKRCETYGWCPPEEDRFKDDTKTSLPGVVNATILIKNSIEFRKFGVKRKNIIHYMKRSYLRKCRYHPLSFPLCPIFRLGDILQHANVNESEVLRYGALISLVITWDCDLDKHVEHCLPKYSFSRLDITENEDHDNETSRGFNFRYSDHYQINNTLHRTLTKAYGIYLFIIVEGKAWKFDIKELTMNIGSGVGLMGIASVICDIFAFYLTNKREKYWTKKFLNADEKCEIKMLDNEDKTDNNNKVKIKLESNFDI